MFRGSHWFSEELAIIKRKRDIGRDKFFFGPERNVPHKSPNLGS